jgi:hypothetical protein
MYHPESNICQHADKEAMFSKIAKAYETLSFHWRRYASLKNMMSFIEYEMETIWVMDHWPGIVVMQVVALGMVLTCLLRPRNEQEHVDALHTTRCLSVKSKTIPMKRRLLSIPKEQTTTMMMIDDDGIVDNKDEGTAQTKHVDCGTTANLILLQNVAAMYTRNTMFAIVLIATE